MIVISCYFGDGSDGGSGGGGGVYVRENGGGVSLCVISLFVLVCNYLFHVFSSM